MTSSVRRDQHADRRHRSRSRSPQRTHNHKPEQSRRDDSRRDRREAVARLPFNSRPLTKHDLNKYRNLFAMYLDVQKQILIEDLVERELRGRWKSFINKWNAGELSEGYYDPQTKTRADDRSAEEHRQESAIPRANAKDIPPSDDEDDGYGPTLPTSGAKSAAHPTRQDLQYRDELDRDARQDAFADARHERKLDRRRENERLDELAPRAEAGTKERQMEKKREKAESNRAFRDAGSPGAEEVGERVLMGADGGIEGYKAKLKAEEKRKTERELRREENLRARAAEREERLAHHRAKEDQTIEMLKALAQQRYG